MSSEEVQQLEIRLLKAMNEMEIRLLKAITAIKDDLKEDHVELSLKVAHVQGGLVYVNIFLAAIGMSALGAVIKYIFF